MDVHSRVVLGRDSKRKQMEDHNSTAEYGYERIHDDAPECGTTPGRTFGLSHHDVDQIREVREATADTWAFF